MLPGIFQPLSLKLLLRVTKQEKISERQSMEANPLRGVLIRVGLVKIT